MLLVRIELQMTAGHRSHANWSLVMSHLGHHVGLLLHERVHLAILRGTGTRLASKSAGDCAAGAWVVDEAVSLEGGVVLYVFGHLAEGVGRPARSVAAEEGGHAGSSWWAMGWISSLRVVASSKIDRVVYSGRGKRC